MTGPWTVRTSKPKGNVRINYAHPLARDIAFFYYEIGLASFYDAVTGLNVGTTSGQTATSQGTLAFNGSARTTTTTAVRLRSDTMNATVDNQHATIIGRVKLTSKPAVKCAAADYANNGTNRGIFIGFDSNGFAGGGAFTSNGMVPSVDAIDHTNQWVVCGGSVDATLGSSQGWLNGIAQTPVFSGSTSAGTLDRVDIGRDNSNYYNNFTGEIDWIVGFNRLLSAPEHAQLARNVWQILVPQLNPAFFSLPAAGGGGGGGAANSNSNLLMMGMS
jgi:hypothetical protein